MAYKQKGCTPITAKLKRTTKGGMVQQPLLDMGAPVNMKESSPTKQGGKRAQEARAKANEARRKRNEAQQRKEEGAKWKKEQDLKTKKTVRNRRGREVANPKYDAEFTKTRKEGEAGWAADDKARKDKTGIYAENKDENTTTPPPPPSVQPVNDKKLSNKRIKDYHGGDVAKLGPQSNKKTTSNTKNVKITGRIGSDLRRKQYDAKGWAYDDTIKKPKSKPKAKAILENNKKTEKKPKLAVAPSKPTAKPTKKQVRKAKSVERKTERAAKARRKSVQALESGNLAKSRRLKRRETRINKRIEKKKSGQASKAIEPK
jgi:hypothetical protein